ncbi:MAG: hypothetical protein V2A34_08410 [Lentisphaerota bacterium]
MNTTTEERKSAVNEQEITRRAEDLKAWFSGRGLDPDKIFLLPEDLERRVASHKNLVRWACAWDVCKSRGKMEKMGFKYPPVDPCVDPDTDWATFEQWITGVSHEWSLSEQVRDYETADVVDEQTARERVDIMRQWLAERNVEAFLQPELPLRIQYACLLHIARNETFPPIQKGTNLVVGCDAFCPDCLQRFWCEDGRETSWPEDEDAGEMVLSEELKKLMNRP